MAKARELLFDGEGTVPSTIRRCLRHVDLRQRLLSYCLANLH